MTANKRFAIGMAAGMVCYVALVTAGALIRRDVGAGPSPAMWGIAGGTIGAGLGVMGVIVTWGRKAKELDRVLFTEGTSLAFFVTMIAALTYGLLEAWVDAPRLSAWTTWAVGMGSWAVLSLVLRRRVS